MRVIIIGAGFSGLALCWFLLERNHEVTILDPKGIGGEASGIAAGLLHPFSGAHAKYNRFGREGMDATQDLLKISEQALGRPVADAKGIVRLAITQVQYMDFKECAYKYPQEIEWWEAEEVKERIPQVLAFPGIYIKQGMTVYSDLYLQGLWKACENRGALFVKKACSSLAEVDRYDQIFLASGAAIQHFVQLPVTFNKGQVVELEWPFPPLEIPINSLGYMTMHHSRTSCLVGSTYERDYETQKPDLEVARKDILAKIEPFFPQAASCKVIDCRAAIRVSTPTHLPFSGRVSEKCWALTGMGSKGLLYHAFFAKQLVKNFTTETQTRL